MQRRHSKQAGMNQTEIMDHTGHERRSVGMQGNTKEARDGIEVNETGGFHHYIHSNDPSWRTKAKLRKC